MSNTALELAKQLVVILSGGDVVPDRVPAKDTGQRLPVAADAISGEPPVFTEDFWVEGRIGALKGTKLRVYNEHSVTIAHLLAGAGIPLHMSVCIPGDALGDCISTAADVGFMNRDDFRWVEGDKAGNYARWIRAGCPHFTSDGRKWSGGEPSNESQWDEWARRMKELGRT